MPNVEIDGTNSTVKTNVLTSQSGTTITVPTGKVLTVTDAAGLTVNGVAPLTSIANDAVTTAKIINNAVTLAKMAGGTDGNIISYDASGDPVAVVTGSSGQVLTSAGAGAPPTFAAAAAGGKLVQLVNVTSTGAVTGTTTFPIDDTIPQNTEGTEMMTLAITPTNASNKLIIKVEWEGAYSASGTIVSVVLFQDTTANALAISGETLGGGANWFLSLSLVHYMTAGTTSATTFKVRAGGHQAGTITMGGSAGVRRYGGVEFSSITIMEIAV